MSGESTHRPARKILCGTRFVAVAIGGSSEGWRPAGRAAVDPRPFYPRRPAAHYDRHGRLRWASSRAVRAPGRVCGGRDQREDGMAAKKDDRKSFEALLRVKPGSKVDVARFDCAATFGRDKDVATDELPQVLARLTDLQARTWAEAKHAVLVVIQGIDAAGKDGTIKVIAGAFNPQGTPVTSFKAPSALELAHDYLWRVHQRVPARGEIGIFNRSHYEDVLIVRVHALVDAPQ